MKKVKNQVVKYRAFAAVLYEESVSADWQVFLSDLHIDAFAIYHDRDVNPNGELKKSHWHLLVYWNGPTTYEKVKKEIFEPIGAVPDPKPVATVRGYARYLCHLDNPEKTQYSKSEIIRFGGWDYEEIIKLPSDDDAITMEMVRFIKKYKVCFFADMVDYAERYKSDWFKVLSHSRTVFIKEYIKSTAYTFQESELPRLELEVVADMESVS